MKRIVVFITVQLFPFMVCAQVPHWQKVAGLDSGNYKSVQVMGDTVYTFDLSRSKLLRTTNAGSEWREVALLPQTEAVFFLNGMMGWTKNGGTNPSGRICSTMDGGANWTKLATLMSLDTINAQQFVFTDSLNGNFMAAKTRLYRTYDGGRSINSRTSIPIVYACISFAIPRIGYIGTTTGPVLFTDNGGERVEIVNAMQPSNPFWPNHKPIQAIRAAAFDTNYCWAAGNTDRSIAIKTYATTRLWNTVDIGPDSTTIFTRICLLSHDRVWIAANSGPNGVVFHTDNGNDTTGNVQWRTDTLENSTIMDLAMQSPDSGWAVGQYVWHYTSWQITSAEAAPLVPALRLDQNYPNPVSSDLRGSHETTIEYTVPERSNVALKIYNVMGKEAATLVGDVREPGRHVARWNAAGQPPGVYLCVLATPRGRVARRIVVGRE
jgi:photosystem II stability/assembly factor-like uncharacterized protein